MSVPEQLFCETTDPSRRQALRLFSSAATLTPHLAVARLPAAALAHPTVPAVVSAPSCLATALPRFTELVHRGLELMAGAKEVGNTLIQRVYRAPANSLADSRFVRQVEGLHDHFTTLALRALHCAGNAFELERQLLTPAVLDEMWQRGTESNDGGPFHVRALPLVPGFSVIVHAPESDPRICPRLFAVPTGDSPQSGHGRGGHGRGGHGTGVTLKDGDVERLLGGVVELLLSNPRGRRALYRTASTLPAPLQQPIRELLTGAPSAQPSAAFHRLFLNTRGYTLGEVRALLEDHDPVNRYLGRWRAAGQLHKSTERPSNEEALIAEWSRATRMKWAPAPDGAAFCADLRVADSRRHTTGVRDILRYNWAQATVSSVNEHAARTGERVTMRAALTEQRLEQCVVLSVEVPRQLFLDPGYPAQLLRDIRSRHFVAQWCDASYESAVRLKYGENRRR